MKTLILALTLLSPSAFAINPPVAIAQLSFVIDRMTCTTSAGKENCVQDISVNGGVVDLEVPMFIYHHPGEDKMGKPIYIKAEGKAKGSPIGSNYEFAIEVEHLISQVQGHADQFHTVLHLGNKSNPELGITVTLPVSPKDASGLEIVGASEQIAPTTRAYPVLHLTFNRMVFP